MVTRKSGVGFGNNNNDVGVIGLGWQFGKWRQLGPNDDGVQTKKANDKAMVTKWDGQRAELGYIYKGEETEVAIDLTKMAVVVKVADIKNGGMKEALLFPSNVEWKKAFCVGDEVKIKEDEAGGVTIRNMGPRDCSYPDEEVDE